MGGCRSEERISTGNSARVIWAREDEVSRWIFAGIEFLQTSES